MNKTPIVPNADKISRTISKAHRVCQEIELAGLELQEAIVKLEQENRAKRRKYLNKLLSSL